MKTYIKPNTNVYAVELQQMIAESMNVDNNTTKSFSNSLGKEENLSDAPSSSVWGSDEEE